MGSAASIRLPSVLIIAGHLIVEAEERDAYVAGCAAVVVAARVAPGNLDFAITADPLDPGRVDVYERWEDEATLLAFRGAGPGDDQQDAILGAEVRRYEVASVGEP